MVSKLKTSSMSHGGKAKSPILRVKTGIRAGGMRDFYQGWGERTEGFNERDRQNQRGF